MKRFDIVKGDTTTAGGVVQGGDSGDLLNGREQAYENDPVMCPACGSVGVIKCDGPRHSMTGPDGRQAALSDDLCICKCVPPPKLIASQLTSYTEV
ncbi:PAAR domain-containing protein [Burkholderia arboris]|uniref:PAAR domain-containing protein n=1 Tax=Burkholderia arboris TaxID=488730 RepID=UPI0004D40932|nr:PAAR domain-containing protein [Burkholderia arboris]MCA8494969.1 PAAR domain-containing protein [Burkholderia arboris]UTV60252.1 PAAR domain-containing protein [Burkholderia arboris]